LGNIRVSYFKNTNGSAEVLEENNFYPFRMKHEGYNQTTGNPSYNYQYGGKELQKETGWSDFGARMYMSDIARWGVIDPLAETTTRVNPYNYALNNPVMFIDPDGRKAFAPEPVEDNIPRGGLADFYLRGGNGSYNEFLGKDMLLFYKGANGAYGGTSYSTFGQTPAYKALMSGQTSNITNENGYLRWNTLDPEDNKLYHDTDGMLTGSTGGVTAHALKVEDKGFLTNLANNRYFSAGHLGVSEANTRFGAYAIRRALNPDYINFTVMSDLARPYAGTTVAGIRMSSTVAANIGKAAKYGGVALGVVSIVATELQYADGQIGETERIMNHIMTGVGFIPSPWTIGAALIYGAVTGGYQAVTGRSIFNDMGLGPKK